MFLQGMNVIRGNVLKGKYIQDVHIALTKAKNLLKNTAKTFMKCFYAMIFKNYIKGDVFYEF